MISTKWTFFTLIGASSVEARNQSAVEGILLPGCGGGACADGTLGDPCCGVGKCNALCMNCDGGCRKKAEPASIPAVPASALSTPLKQWPMLLSHDAATSYFASNTCELLKAESNFVMTQVPGTITDQLNCGARAFDLRPYSDGKTLMAHHGPVHFKVKIADILEEIVEWASKNPGEFVLVYGSHEDGPNAKQMFLDELKTVQVPQLDCKDVPSITLGDAMEKGKLPKGGHVLAIWDCVAENFDVSITCYGNGGGRRLASAPTNDMHPILKGIPDRHSCYGSGAEKAFDPFWAYMKNTTDGRGLKDKQLWMTQAHWQYTPASIIQGELEDSCILKDDAKSKLNAQLVQKISKGAFPHINLFEVNNICGGQGPALLKALRSRLAPDEVVV